MVAEHMVFSYTDRNTVEWLVRDANIVIKMAVAQGDNDFAMIWFENTDGQVVGHGQYELRRGGLDGETAPYAGDAYGYIVDYRKNYTMVRPDNQVLFVLNHHKQQGWFSSVEYIVRRKHPLESQP